MNRSIKHVLQYFVYEHLPPHLQAVSKPFAELAQAIDKASVQPGYSGAGYAFQIRGEYLDIVRIVANMEGEEAVMALRKLADCEARLHQGIDLYVVLRTLLEAKDCAVRAALAQV